MLPVAEILPQLCLALAEHNRVILSAPPGAGKSTYLPLYLLQQPQFAGKKILLLEPRRLAARSIAAYLAQQLGEPVGQTVGYQIRQESQFSAATRLLIVTEGILTRKIQQDPLLSTVDLLIFDEFHERSLHADLGLALALEVQQLNEQLKLLVMSATLDCQALQQYLQAQLLQSEGRSYPVEIRYQPPLPVSKEPLGLQAARLALQAYQQHGGNVLVFLPGQAEIQQAAGWLRSQSLPPELQVWPLLGSLSLAQQQAAIAAPPADQHKIVLATNLAETSLTIEGITVVIDSGQARRASYQARSGLTKLETIAISQAAAIQRAGRAGRLAPGICYRLDTPEQWQRRPAFEPAEIELAELTQLRLELAVWGCQPEALSWLTAPASGNLAAATTLLQQLQVLDSKGQLTGYGRELYQFGTDIRLASMLQHAQQLEATTAGAGWLAALLAALLEDSRPVAQDLYQQLALLQQRRPPFSQLYPQAEQFARKLKVSKVSSLPLQLVPTLLLRAFPDRLAQRRGQGYLMANGCGAVLAPDDPLSSQALLVVTASREYQQQNRISQAVAITLDEVLVDWPELSWQRYSGWDEQKQVFFSEQQLRFGQLVLQRKPMKLELDRESRQQAWLDTIQRKGLAILPFNEHCRQLQQRLALARTLDTSLPDLSDTTLVTTLPNWLGPYLGELNKLTELQQLPLYNLLWQQLSYQQQQQLNELLPEHWQTPAGSIVSIDYTLPGGPGFSVRVQEIYGQLVSPSVLRGQLPLTLTLLSPGRQPLQITRDLASFWQQAWPEVKKEMKGRYPKHYWPDNPATALPTTKTKKAMQL